MKTRLTLLLFCLAQFVALGQEKKTLYPITVADMAGRVFLTVRSNISAQMKLRLKAREFTPKDLQAIPAVLDDATNILSKAGFDEKLDAAARQVEKVQPQIVGSLKDPRNKTMALQMQPETWLYHINLRKSQSAILQSEIVRLRGVLQEIETWATALGEVVPPQQLMERIKTRLSELVAEWEEGTTLMFPKPTPPQASLDEGEGHCKVSQNTTE